MFNTFLLPFKTTIVKIAVTADNKLHLAVNGHYTTYDLTNYHFDINKPIKSEINHLFSVSFIKEVKQFIKTNIGRFLLMPKIDFQIAISHLKDKSAIDHFLDFTEALFVSKTSLLELTIPVDLFLQSDKINENTLKAIRNNRTPGLDTKYFNN